MPSDAMSPNSQSPNSQSPNSMSQSDPAIPFPYLRWAKAHLTWADTNLGMSGVEPPTPAERAALGLAPATPDADPAQALREALARRYGMQPDCVHLAAGTSHANFVTYLALARGGHIAVETPAYEALHRLAPAVNASLSTFRRDPQRGWRIDREELAAAVRPETCLIVVTDLHNPSGLRLSEGDLDVLLEAAEGCDAHVLVDEVYAEFDPQRRPTAARRHPRVLVTSSLTKVHGLGELRAGWILAHPATIERIEAWDDLVNPGLPPGPLREALAFLPGLDERLASTRALAATRAAQVDEWVQATPYVEWTRPHGGLTGFLHVGGALDGDALAARLQGEYGLCIVPGSFFQAPDWLRLSYLLPEAALADALTAIGRLLEVPR